MRSITVLEVRRGTGRYAWAWGLANPVPPGFERVWFTSVGGHQQLGDLTFDNVVVVRELFTYTTRESVLEEANGGG